MISIDQQNNKNLIWTDLRQFIIQLKDSDVLLIEEFIKNTYM